MSRTVTSSLPSTAASTGCNGDATPRRCAMATPAVGVTSSMSCANTVLIDRTSASRSVIRPPPPVSEKLDTSQVSSRPGIGSSILLGAGYRALIWMPCSSAAASTNGLNPEPAWRPPWVARLNRADGASPKKSRPPTMASTCPVSLRITTIAADGPPSQGRMAVRALSAACCTSGCSVV